MGLRRQQQKKRPGKRQGNNSFRSKSQHHCFRLSHVIEVHNEYLRLKNAAYESDYDYVYLYTRHS